EGRDWLDRALATGAGTARERGTGLYHAGRLAFMQGDAESALSLFREAIDLAASVGDDDTLATALGWCGYLLAQTGAHEEALEMMHRCQKLASRLSDPSRRSEAMFQVAAILSTTVDLNGADALNRDLLAIK